MIIIPNTSDRQASFIRDMLAELFADAPAGTADAVLIRNVECGLFATRADASAAIAALIAKRDAVRVARKAAGVKPAAAGETVVEPGYYAVERDGTLYFYSIVAGKGRWTGRTFVNRYRSDEELRVGRTEAADVRRIIAADPEAARMRFAAELTRCYHCARMLTDELSRELGIGPVCREK